MKNDEYKKISSGLGQEIRNLLNDAVRDSRYLMGRRELNERLMEILPTEDMAPVRDALATKFKQYAEKAQDHGARWGLRGQISELALHVVTEMEKGDRIMPVPEEEVIDVGAVADDIHYGSRIGGELDRKNDKERAEAQALLKKAGLL